MGDMQYLEELLKKTHQVREATEDSCEIDAVERYATGFNSWLQHDALMLTSPIWDTALFESSVLAGASFFLVVHGFYEEACAILRAVLDGFLTRLYWNTKHKNGKLREWKEHK